MKLLLIILLFSISMGGFAQQSALAKLRTRISDDEKTLLIQIDGNRDGQKIQLDQTFAVTGMSSLGKELLTYRAFNSVGLLPPLNEMPWLIFTVLGILMVGIALLTVSVQSVKAALMNPVKSLRSE
ncbi:MAG: hypothetical protein LH609_12990 [Rudanella sp.]|nr:hypothetical protein [Rudanella sp.]